MFCRTKRMYELWSIPGIGEVATTSQISPCLSVTTAAAPDNVHDGWSCQKDEPSVKTWTPSLLKVGRWFVGQIFWFSTSALVAPICLGMIAKLIVALGMSCTQLITSAYFGLKWSNFEHLSNLCSLESSQPQCGHLWSPSWEYLDVTSRVNAAPSKVCLQHGLFMFREFFKIMNNVELINCFHVKILAMLNLLWNVFVPIFSKGFS